VEILPVQPCSGSAAYTAITGILLILDLGMGAFAEKRKPTWGDK
jgi:hypothetical protein